MLLIAHRGASGHAPENTLAAFRLALEMGAKAVELDVHQARDGELVVIHDEDLKRTGRRKGRIRDLSWKELSSVDVGGDRIPLLEEVMDLIAGKAELHLELKRGSRYYQGIEARILALLRKREALKTTLISSFDHRALFVVRELEPEARLGYLRGFTRLGVALKEAAELGAESINLSLRQAKPAVIRECRKRGFKTLVYTVNKPRDLVRLAQLGVDGVFSNLPDLAA